MKNTIYLAFGAVMTISALFIFARTALAAEEECLKCHRALIQKKVVHAAVYMGCSTCHTSLNTNMVPHRRSTNIRAGLAAKQLDLCLGCHDKGMFNKKVNHDAISMGCTSCHDPHSSMQPKLLTLVMPELCYNCHDAAMFTGKSATHPNVTGIDCTTCHNPHSSNSPQLLGQ